MKLIKLWLIYFSFAFNGSISRFFIKTLWSIDASPLWYTLSKCPGGHPILHRWLKLNLKNSAGKYKKIELTGVSWFFTGELSKNFQNIYLQLWTEYLRQTLFMYSCEVSSTRKNQFLFLSSCLLVLTKFLFWEEDWALGYNPS